MPILISASLILSLFSQLLMIAFSISFFIKPIHQHTNTMTDLLITLGSIGFFGLMCLFIWACEKV